jgi:thymidylate synthase (FAD)
MEKILTVKLVGITKPVDINQTIDEFIAYVARVSNPTNQNNTATAAALIKYLINHEHWSPLEMAHMVLQIDTTRDIGRQILRHGSFKFQEFSQRYANVSCDFVYREARLQDPKNRQSSIPLDLDNPIHQSIAADWQHKQEQVADTAKAVYEWAINSGIAKEQARVVLPEGMTPTTMYMAGSIRSWFHYCSLRVANGTQLEHQLVAKDALLILFEQFPSIKEVFKEH